MSDPPIDSRHDRLNVLVWHVHGSWTTSFVQGEHTYLVPTDPALGSWALGRCGRSWPDRAIEIAPADLVDTRVDAVVLQRPRELDLVREWLGREPGSEIPAVYVEHNTPREHAARTRHPLADRTDIPLVHVTDFNNLMWDNGCCPTVVIPHGVLDPGYRYSGELPRAATSINEPLRRWRVTGTDLLSPLSDAAPIDVYGIATENLHHPLHSTPDRIQGCGDLNQAALHRELARHRMFVHTPRWTSLGLSLIEAMYLGMPVVAVGTAEAALSVPAEAGIVSTDLGILAEAMRQLLAEPAFAELTGKYARQWARATFGIDAFVRRWDELLTAQVFDTRPTAIPTG
ncbi:glycosyltransferase [Nocardia sp. BMG51109]|uniref:glycosyltransferase n=1 Tax=Nocardia sp. BMG51109 TaxID=1056816 RepID=UPI0004B68CDC|nr:glycosyltransferase [Nocardia sp. BMG51109]